MGGSDEAEADKDTSREAPGGLRSVSLGAKRRGGWRGCTYEEALADAKSTIKFHIETFGDKRCLQKSKEGL